MLSFTAVNFIRFENNLPLQQLFMLLELSEQMFWIGSMPRVTYNYLQLAIGWIGLGLTFLCMCDYFWEESNLSPGVLKRTLPIYD